MTFMCKFCLFVMVKIYGNSQISFFCFFSGRPYWKWLFWQYCLWFAFGIMFHQKEHKNLQKKVDLKESWGSVHWVLLHPRLTCIFCDPFDLSDPKIDPFSNQDYFVRQLWFVNSFRWFRESTGSICSQAKHLTTISIFFTSLTQTHDFDPLFKVLLVKFSLAPGDIQSGLKWF